MIAFQIGGLSMLTARRLTLTPAEASSRGLPDPRHLHITIIYTMYVYIYIYIYNVYIYFCFLPLRVKVGFWAVKCVTRDAAAGNIHGSEP